MLSLIKVPNYKHWTCLFVSIAIVSSCISNANKPAVTVKDKFVKPRAVERETKRKDSLKAVLKSNLNFFADSLLGGNQAPVQAYMKRYQPDTCGILTYKNDRLKENFEGIATVRKINGDKGRDSVVVIPPFNYCDEGDSYFFNDQKLPRLYTQSNCCHPNNLFVVEDIDEDGTREIGIFYSSCTSRFKALNIYSLQQNEWVKIAESTFDIFTKDPGKVKFNTLVRKIKKGEFKVCNFNDGKTTWETITMKAVLRR